MGDKNKDWVFLRKKVQYCKQSGKVMFTKIEAVTAANQRYKQDHLRLRVYPCPDCNSWHLTKRI